MKTILSHSMPLLLLLVILGIALVAGFRPPLELYLFFIVGFSAQLIDGALGMGFGMVSTATMLGFGINPTTISSSVHTAEVFSSAASGISHHQNGNISKKLFLSLLIPGVTGSIIGAMLLVVLSDINSDSIRLIIATYTMLLGLRLIYLFARRRQKPHLISKTSPKIKPLALMGGFLDSFGGGGWGPIVTTSLVNRGHEPRYVIGSVNSAEFFIALASSVTFFIAIGISHWGIVLALVCGGVCAAPIAAKLTNKMKADRLLLMVGLLVITWSLYTILRIF